MIILLLPGHRQHEDVLIGVRAGQLVIDAAEAVPGLEGQVVLICRAADQLMALLGVPVSSPCAAARFVRRDGDMAISMRVAQWLGVSS